MEYVYLDHNIFIETLENRELKELLNKIKSDETIEFLYSPAHIEEVYKVAKDINSKNRSKMKDLIKNISEITNNNEVLPSLQSVIIKKEKPLDCYKRVKEFDTTEKVKSDSIVRYEVDKKNYKKLLAEDKKNVSISKIDFDKIWENDLIKDEINKLNNNISVEIERYNNSAVILFNKILMGVDKSLSSNLCFKKGNYEFLKNSYNDLEYTIEVLFRILNHYGYNADKSEHTSISGTHDVTHAIYATIADYLISTDLRFVKKCKAVYYYLGIKTEVVHVKQNEIANTLNNILR
ncbi:hypothetical protein LFJ63_002918 [Clostridium perfringens]|nr:hypothetical protein [Clostridium perfringens]